MQPPGHQIGHPVAHPQHPGAEQPEVRPAPQKQKHRPVQPHHPAPGPLGPEEQRRRQGHPEQQVQGGAQQGQPHPHPQDAEQVVQQSGGQPQPQGLDHRPGLGGYIGRHPPSSRANRPTRSRPPSS